MTRGKHIHFTDLLLLRKLFCGSQKTFLVFDPHHLLKEVDYSFTIIHEQEELPADKCDVFFNLSGKEIPVKSSFNFHFNPAEVLKGTKFFYINNPDGTMRWINLSADKTPGFLSLYNAGNLKGKLYKNLVNAAYWLHMKSYASSGFFYLEQNQKNEVEKITDSPDTDSYSIFTGTKGENRKIIIGIQKKNKTTHYIKIALSESATRLVQNEVNMLTSLIKYDFSAFSLPQPSPGIDPRYAKISNVKPGVVLSANKIRDVHIKTLAELYSKQHDVKKIKDTSVWVSIANQLQLLDKEHHIWNELDHTMVYDIINKLFVVHNAMDVETEIPVSFAHGDFTPWNMYSDGNRLYVYDWELGGTGIPMLMDLYHFIFQSNILLFRKDAKHISKDINEALSNKLTRSLISKYNISTQLHYELYLLFTVSYYLRLYIHQNPLHVQAHWLVSTWHKALKDIRK